LYYSIWCEQVFVSASSITAHCAVWLCAGQPGNFIKTAQELNAIINFGELRKKLSGCKKRFN